MEKEIYLDNNATTALDPQVLKAMLLDLSGPPANPSSVHSFGRKAKTLLANARQKVATFFKVKPEEILFTSGGTESINYLLRNLSGHVITSNVEHAAIDKTLQALPLEVTYLPVGLYGAPLLQQIEEAIRSNTKALIFSASNSETGVKIDLEAIAKLAQMHHIPLFIDAVSYIGKEPFTLYPGITAVALSAHKFHGPKGIGALFLRSSYKLLPEITGGAQENMRRAGTENLAGILGLAQALELLANQSEITSHLLELRLQLEEGLKKALPDIIINGQGPRISNTLNIAFPNVDGETLLMQLDLANIAVSHGSACSSGSLEPSRILLNMGIPHKTSRSSIRLSLSRFNTKEEVEIAIDKISQIVRKLREI